LSIDTTGSALFPDGVQVLTGDVTDLSVVKAAMENVEAVIHLAALLHIANPSPALAEKYEKINVGGTATVVEAAVQAGVERVVFFSTIAVYGDSHQRILDEDSSPLPRTYYAQTKLAAERIVLNAKHSDGQPFGTVLRFGAIYGPRIKGNYLRLLHSLSRGRFIPIGNGNNRRTLIYDKDVASAALLAAKHQAAAGKIFNVSDGHFHTLNEIIAAMCKALGRKPPRLSLPVGPVRLAAGILEDMGHKIGYQLPIGRATIDKYTEDIAVSSERIQTELGFKPQYDLLTGWQETIQEMRRMGEL
jgi:UDP-glucose 4-epimerase